MYLRKCRHCGIEAKSEQDLSNFKKGNRSKHGHDNCCHTCASRRYKIKKQSSDIFSTPLLNSIAKRERYRNNLESNPCWIYVITNDCYPDWCKLGRTTRKDINDRLSQYNTYSPTNNFKLEYSKWIEDFRIEGDVIDSLKIKGIEYKGEWFKCSLETLLYHIENYNKIIEDYKKELYLKRCKPVVQLDLNGNFIAEYESMSAAADATGVHLGSLGYVCKTGLRKLYQTGGFMWKLKEEYDNEQNSESKQ